MHFLFLMTESKVSTIFSKYQNGQCEVVYRYNKAAAVASSSNQPHSSRPLLTQNWKPMTDGETAAANQYRFGLKMSTTKLVIGPAESNTRNSVINLLNKNR